MKRNITCIRCPVGCQLVVEFKDNSVAVTGNSCPRGSEYGSKEVINPMRMVTSTIKVSGGKIPMVSVKTDMDIPKGKIFDVMKYLEEDKDALLNIVKSYKL